MTEALTLNDFASQLSAASVPDGQAQEAPDDASQEEQQIEDTTAEVVEPEGEQSPEGEATEEADSDDGQAAKAPNEEMVIKWTTASGETHEAPLKELKDGYLRHSDYTQKAQQLSQDRERAHNAVMEQFQQVQALGPELGRMQQVQEQIGQYQKLDWNAIQAQDPALHNRLTTEFLVLREQGKELQQLLQNKAGAFEAQKTQRAAEADAEATAHLNKAVKGFGKKDMEAMDALLTERGITGKARAEFVAGLGKENAKVVYEALHKSIQWDALQAKKPQIDNRAKAIPPKPAARAQQSKPTSQQEQIAKAVASNRPMSGATFADLLAQTRKK